MTPNRMFNYPKDYSHYLAWILFVVGFVFFGALVFQLRILIDDIRSKQEILWQIDQKMRVQSKAIAEKINSGEAVFDRLFSEHGTPASYAESSAWNEEVDNFVTTTNGRFQETFGILLWQRYSRWSHTKWCLAVLLDQLHQATDDYDRVYFWRESYESNLREFDQLRQKTDELTVRMKSLIDEQNGLRRIERALATKKNRTKQLSKADENDADNYDAFLTEISELRVLLEQLYHSTDMEEFRDLEANNLVPAISRVHNFIESLQSSDLKDKTGHLLDDLSTQIFGSNTKVETAASQPAIRGLLANTRSRIELIGQKALLDKEVWTRFDRLESLQVDLISSFNQRILEFQKDVDRQLESFWISRLLVSLIGAFVLLLFAVLIMEKFRRQTLHLRKMAEDLYDQRKLALESVEAKSNFVANMSHEIRTPMNAILGFSDLLSRTKLTADQKKYLDIVKSSGTLLIGIINDILDVSKLESGTIRLEQIEFSLEEVIKDVFKMVVMRIKDRPFDTYVQIADDVPQSVVGDPTRLKQVFVNLLGNAVKFTTSGSVGVIVTREPSAMPWEIALKVMVKDTGIGIPEDKLDAIFEPFTQADESTTRKFGGTGLGLTICKSLIQAMGGKIWVESKVGIGTEFIFTIKLGEVQTKKQLPEPPVNRNAWLAGKTVFIVDDNLIANKLLVKKCELLGLRVFGVADSGYSALSKLEKLIATRGVVPDIIFSDIMMDGMSGFEFIRRLKQDERYKSVKYIAVTADPNAKDPAMSPGKFNAYIIKPVFWDDLVAALEEAFHAVETRSETKPAFEPETGEVRILVVEDTETNVILMEQYFDQFKWKGVFVSSGREAIDYLRKDKQFDLCLMDLQMPDIGGIEATTIIRREISKDLPIIALSASVMEKDFQEAMESGMNGFLNKPVIISQLKEVVTKYAVRMVKKSE